MSDKLNRRDFIKKSAIGVVAGGAMISGFNITNLLANSSGKAKAVFTKSGDDIVVTLADKKNKPLTLIGGSLIVNDETILIHTSQTQFTALSLICAHKGCTVEKDGDKFVCPCHGSEYTLNGKVTTGPSKKDLIIYETVYDAEKNTVTIKMTAGEKKEEKKEVIQDSTKVKDK